ncbi:MAG: type II secretion system protein GspC [Desulfobacterales bacterium]|nr:type II secretion system protein GspC [Desulfobacterales bacterium]MDD3080714.1 type II secretion system protein GspC [Desulfobacterales bacterium]MDD3949535.1 type II secretion system protein GspC [Desulfobacterales bacterium]MDD4462727.1 type II secretion system protein GspC [Desulfobacterales bacterium]
MKRYFTLINILLVTGIIYLSISGVYKLMAVRRTDLNAVTVERPPSNHAIRDEAKLSMDRYKPIVSRNLFQTGADSQPETRSIDLEALKQSELNLKLWGTVAGGTGQRAYAVIEDQTRKTQDLYKVDDSIQGAEIRMIFREKVVLNVNGRDEVLRMEERSDAEPGRPAEVPQTRPESPERVSVPRERVDNATGNINELMKQARLRPHFQGGKPAGLIITRIQDDSIFSDMGLQNGDVLVGVDGNPIQSVDDALQLYQGMKESSEVKLHIVRQGQEQSIEYRVQ